MKSCRINWKLYIGVFLYVNVIVTVVVIEGRPQSQQQHHRPYNTFNITLVPYPTPQYQQYNQQYQRYNLHQYPYHQSTRTSRNISQSNNYQPVVDPTVDRHGTLDSGFHFQPVIDPTVPQHQERFGSQPQQQQNPVVFNNDNSNRDEINGHKSATQSVGSVQDGEVNGSRAGVEHLHRNVRNSTVVQLPASGAGPAVTVAKEKTRILTHHVNPSRGALAEDLRGSTQDIIFPDSFENLFDPITRLDTMPQCARGALFCEDIPTYPYHQIRDSLRRSSVNGDLFFDDEVDAPKEIANRISGPEDKFICKSIERTIYPKVGMTKNNKWKYIINQNQEGYIQGVRVETCLYADRPCDLSEHMPLGVVTSCKQKYVTRRMMSLADDGVPLPDIFLMPSACCCSYRMENPLLRARNVDTTPIPEE